MSAPVLLTEMVECLKAFVVFEDRYDADETVSVAEVETATARARAVITRAERAIADLSRLIP